MSFYNQPTSAGCLSVILPFFQVVPQRSVMVIERFGRYHRLAESGMNILLPFLDRARDFTYYINEELPNGQHMRRTLRTQFLDLREQVLDFPRQSVITADNVVMEINAILYFRIKDPVKAMYEVANFSEAIEKLTQTTLRNVVGELTLDETLSSRDQINGRLLSVLDEATNNWGVDITRVELQDIIPPPDIRQTMELQMTAERRRRAQLLESEASKASAILRSEGEAEARVREAESRRQARVLDAKGEAEAARSIAEGRALARQMMADAEANAMRTLGEAMGTQSAVQYLLGLRYLESLEKMADGQATKTFIPYEATGVLSSIGALRDMFSGETKSVAAPVTKPPKTE